MATLVDRSPTPGTAASAAALRPASRQGVVAGKPSRLGSAALRAALPGLQTALAALATLGAGVLVASLLVGRSALLWPSARWALVCATTTGGGVGLWWLATFAAEGRAWQRWQAAAWPTLALLPAALAAIALYVDDASNHLATTYLPAKQSLLAYAALCLVAGHTIYWAMVVVAHSRVAAPAAGALAPPLFLAIAGAAYVNSSVYLQWVPHQTDLLVNLAGARALRAGDLPYNDVLPIWENRVHLLPATLLFLFGPLSALPDGAARLLFFLANQALWLAAVWLFIRQLAPANQRLGWLAGALILGATYGPWQESIRFGQQDGLLVLLFVLSIVAAAAGRERTAGIALGIALVVKPLSIWFPLAFLLHGRWRTLLIAGVTAAGIAALSLPFTGWTPWWHFLTVEVPAMLPGTVRGTNIPLPSLHARLFVSRAALGDAQPAPTLAVISALNLAASVLALLLVGRMRLRPEPDRTRAWLLDATMGLTLTLLLAPMAWQHYASWLCLAFLVLALPVVWQPLPAAARLGAAALAGAGYLLLSLEDDKLLRLLSPLVDRWPALMSFYAAGLLCIAGAVAIARFGRKVDSPTAPEPVA